MKNNTKNSVRKSITAILFTAMMIASVFAVIALSASAAIDRPFSYTITATGTEDTVVYPDQSFTWTVTGTGTEIWYEGDPLAEHVARTASVTATDSGSGTVNKLEGNKDMGTFSAYPLPQHGGTVSGVIYSITDNNSNVNTWISGNHVNASTEYSETQGVFLSDTETGSSSVNIDEGDKYITTSIFEAPNHDTSWSVSDDSDYVDTWMDGNELYARAINQPPVANAGPDQTIEQTYYWGADVTLDSSGSSDPDGDPLTYTWTRAGGSATGVSPIVSLPLGMTTITLTVNDGEFTDTDTVVINVVDTAPPNVDAGPDISVEQATAAGTEVTLSATVSDICDAGPTVTWSHGPTAVFTPGSTTVTVAATDASGNSASDTVVVTVVDTTDPVITCPADVTVEQATAAGTVVPLTATATDNSDASPTITSDELAIYPLGTTTVTFTATDDSGNNASCSMTVTVVDTTPPVISLVGADPQTIECGDAYTELGATATDVCCGDLTASIVINTSAVDTSTVGSYTVTYDVTDCNGNPAVQVTRTVNVLDTTPPVITCPADVTVEQESATGTVVPLTATATDICDVNPTITSDELAIYPLGSTTVTFTATDASGNSVSDTVVVNVVDTTPPELIIPDDKTVEQETRDGTVVPLEATATDSSDPDVEITSDAPAIFPLGSTTGTFTATDDSDNTATCTTTVTVIDTTPPDISVTVSPDTLWPPNHKMVDIVANVTVSDICDAAPSVVLTNVTSNEPGDAKGKPWDSQDSTSGDGSTINDIQGAEIGTGDYNFQLRAERAGKGDGRVYTITYTVTDASGNSASASTTVVVPHDMD